MTLRDALRQAIERFERHGISNPRLAAEVLVAHCLSVDKAYLYTHDEHPLSEEQIQWLEDSIWDRISGVPLQYIVGRQEFYGRYFAVNASVLIPRPETELIVEKALSLRPANGSRIVDVGTGSGCIGVTLALELPQTNVVLADISFDALLTAHNNALHLGARVEIVCMDLLDAVTGPFDLIVSNPPYVSYADATRLQREVREHEPQVALFAGEDGLAPYRRLIPSAERILRPGGYLIMEIGFAMEERVLGLFNERWERLPTGVDLQGIPRVICARLKPATDESNPRSTSNRR